MKNNKKTIGVDVDGVMLDISDPWMRYLKRRYPFKGVNQWNSDVENGCIDYNLGNYFNIPPTENSLKFFKYEKLYDKLSCYESARIVLQKLYEEGWNIIFISYCADCGSHAKSKAQMLQRECNFIAPEDFHFVQTKSKGVFAGVLTAFIDDRNSFINQLLDSEHEVLCIKKDTPYKQDEELLHSVPVVQDWYDVYEILGENNG